MSQLQQYSVTGSNTIRQSNGPSLLATDGSRQNWDGVRRDQDLWDPHGDCKIYLYAQGQSRRGPSFQVSFQSLVEAKCGLLLDLANQQAGYDSPSPARSTHSTHEPSADDHDQSEVHQIYIGAPQHLSRDEAFTWHITTRNFFAWLLCKPLVGSLLSRALIDLLGRMSMYRESSVDNVADLLHYTDSIGYSAFTNQPELALAMLAFTDEFKLEDNWIDAFVHCVGMRDQLSQCQEYQVTRNVNKALITRAALQMDLRLESHTRSINSFLDEEFSESRIKLSQGGRRHLDHFRSFLHSHFVATYGYWPPTGDQHAKSLQNEMLEEFDCLYTYLADMSRSQSITKSKLAGEISVGEIITSFNGQQDLEPLPFDHPLIPIVSEGSGYRTQAQWALRNWKIGTKDKSSHVDSVRRANVAASNREDPLILESSLVQAYERFESDIAKSFDDKLSFADARKVRWALVYGMVQMLLSATQAPAQVRDADSAPYPVCCSVAGIPAWAQSLSSATHAFRESYPTNHNVTRPAMTKFYSEPSPHISSGLFETEQDEDVGPNYPLTNGSIESPQLYPLLPKKSVRRSLYVRSPSGSTTPPYIPEPSLARKFADLDIGPLEIPTRSSSRRWPTSSSQGSEIQNSPTRTKDRPASADSDDVPSLNWSGASPSASSDSASDQLETLISDDSSSIYSLHEETIAPPKRNPARFKAETNKDEAEESYEKDFWAHDGEFICPGLHV